MTLTPARRRPCPAQPLFADSASPPDDDVRAGPASARACSDVAWEREPDWYDSSPIAERPYCRDCGTSLGFRFKDGSENMDLTVASFDDPSGFVPKHHFGAESMHRAWLNTDGLEEIRTEEYQKLVDKWVDATGSFPG